MDKTFVITLAVLAALTSVTDAKPVYQFLEPREGYVPVYIRFGDQSLAEINPSLAEAFGEHEVSARNVKSDSGPSAEVVSFDLRSLLPSSEAVKETLKNLPSLPHFADIGKSKSSEETTTKKE